MIRDFKEGAKVVIDEACLDRMFAHSKSVATSGLSDSFLNTAQAMLHVTGTVTKRFHPGYEFNVTWPVPYRRNFDGKIQDVTILQLKDNWVSPLDDQWTEV